MTTGHTKKGCVSTHRQGVVPVSRSGGSHGRCYLRLDLVFEGVGELHELLLDLAGLGQRPGGVVLELGDYCKGRVQHAIIHI